MQTQTQAVAQPTMQPMTQATPAPRNAPVAAMPQPQSFGDVVALFQAKREAILAAGSQAEHLFVSGDSGGGNLTTSLAFEARRRKLSLPAGLILFSPELSMALDEPSITENADRDILPWNIPVRPYLNGLDPHDARVSAVDADLRGFPPTFVAFGGDEMLRRGVLDVACDARAGEQHEPEHEEG